ncbi:hypothetical protein MMC10_008310 [Thelotrema lepadinum]|nr:hypothetical protein [Thelotrema lepadinum]
MAGNEPQFFKDSRKKGEIVVSDPPKFDLEAYIANYRGKTRISRLYHIARTSSYLYAEAAKAAVIEAKQGKDLKIYEQAIRLLQQLAPQDSEAAFDKEWIERTLRETTAETQRLDGELKGYKNNLIKESIRMGYDDMGRHCQQIGQLGDATKAFNKEREYCQLPSHIAIMYSRLVNVSIEAESWINVETNVQKLRGVNQKANEAEKMDAKLSAAAGLAQLASAHYKAAAQSFIECNPRMIQARLDDTNSEEAYNEVLTPNDIATYGALCALATMDRNELQTQVLENSNFRNYLELEPHLRRAISAFVACKYSLTLEILESYRTDYLLDLYLSRHFNELFNLVRNKAVIQYFVPFSAVTFSSLATSFNTDEDTIVKTLAELIKSDSLPARLDIEKGLLVANKKDARTEMYEQTMATAKDYERTLHLRLLRMEIVNAGLEVKSPMQKDVPMSQSGLSDTLMGLGPQVRGARGVKNLKNYFQ